MSALEGLPGRVRAPAVSGQLAIVLKALDAFVAAVGPRVDSHVARQMLTSPELGVTVAAPVQGGAVFALLGGGSAPLAGDVLLPDVLHNTSLSAVSERTQSARVQPRRRGVTCA